MVPLEKDSSLEMDIHQLTNIKLEITGNNEIYKYKYCNNEYGMLFLILKFIFFSQ